MAKKWNVQSPIELDPKKKGKAKSKRKKPKKGYRFIDLFAGIGGMRLGFEAHGNTCVFSSEWDLHSQKTYEENFHEKPRGDITDIEAKEIPDFEILLAGFPCQPFSTIGQRKGFDHPTQGTLFHDIVRILKEKKPRAFLLENVPGLVTHDKGATYETIMRTLEIELKYKVFPWILDSVDFGVPQRRSRLYLVGISRSGLPRDFAIKPPQRFPKRAFIDKFVESNVSGHSISRHLQRKYIFKKDDGRPQILNSGSRKVVVKTLVSSYHKIQRLTGTFVADGETGLRLLTENECRVIMGFPGDFRIPVSRTQMYRQYGNSVAVPVIEEIARVMTLALNDLEKTMPGPKGKPSRRRKCKK